MLIVFFSWFLAHMSAYHWKLNIVLRFHKVHLRGSSGCKEFPLASPVQGPLIYAEKKLQLRILSHIRRFRAISSYQILLHPMKFLQQKYLTLQMDLMAPLDCQTFRFMLA